jgi:hypothetical protein
VIGTRPLIQPLRFLLPVAAIQKMKNWIIVVFCFWTLTAEAQYYGDEVISKKSFSPWNADSPKDYSNLYHFGFSEGEGSLRIIVFDTTYVAQVTYYEWIEDHGFINKYRNLKDVRIQGNKFYSRETDGEFIIYEDENRTIKGLLIYDPWTFQFNEGGEFGAAYLGTEKKNVPGKFPNASLEILNQNYLKIFEEKDLKVMRNEIFARYGYKFIEGGEMYQYFKSEKWYIPFYEDVSEFLTAIEKCNIETIMKIEKERTAANHKK